MEKLEFMYILEKGYWTMTDLKTKAMKAAYDAAIKYDRKIVYPKEIEDVIDEILTDVESAVKNSKGVKMPLLYVSNRLAYNPSEEVEGILMEERDLIKVVKLYIMRSNPGF